MKREFSELDFTTLRNMIRDAEQRVGSFILSGGRDTDPYVQDQKKKVQMYYQALQELISR